MTINKSFLNRVFATLAVGVITLIIIQVKETYGLRVGAPVIFLAFIVPIINGVIRYFSWSKSFISSKLNLFTTKYHRSLMVDLPMEDAFGKFVEVISESKFRVQKVSHSDFEIFAITGIKWVSLGENIYIKFENSNNVSRMVFTSISFKGFDLESNHQNLIDLVNRFENSLTI